MTIEERKEENGILLIVEGRIDTNTSVKLQGDVLKALQKSSTLTVDLAGSDYVSSAGLRVFLIAHKTAGAKGGSFKLRNVCEEIMDILTNTGFINFLEIEG